MLQPAQPVAEAMSRNQGVALVAVCGEAGTNSSVAMQRSVDTCVMWTLIEEADLLCLKAHVSTCRANPTRHPLCHPTRHDLLDLSHVTLGSQVECTDSDDPDFWARGLHPVTRSTPLQLIVPRVAQHGVDEDNLRQFTKAAKWMIDSGADPHAVAPASCTGIVSLRFDARESSIEVRT